MTTRKYIEPKSRSRRASQQDKTSSYDFLEPSGLFGYSERQKTNNTGSVEYLSAETYTERRISKYKQELESPNLIQVKIRRGKFKLDSVFIGFSIIFFFSRSYSNQSARSLTSTAVILLHRPGGPVRLQNARLQVPPIIMSMFTKTCKPNFNKPLPLRPLHNNNNNHHPF